MPRSSARTHRTRTGRRLDRRWEVRSRPGKRMPENHTLHLASCRLQENGKGFGTIRRIEGQSMLRSEDAGPLTRRRGIAVTRAETIYDLNAELTGPDVEQLSGLACQPSDAPPVRDEGCRDPHGDH